MMVLKFTARILMLAIAGLLTSCLDCREEYWLRADGSGRAEITYHLPVAAASIHGGESGVREMIAGFLRRTPEITGSTCEVATVGDRIQVQINATFDSAMDLKEIAFGAPLTALPSAASHLVGEIRTDLRGRTLDFTRRITPSQVLPGSAFLPASRFEGHRMLYIMHLPTAPTASNATRVENAGRTLVWDIPLARAVRAPVVTHFKMQLPIPWRLVSAIALPLSLIACASIFLRVRKSRSSMSR